MTPKEDTISLREGSRRLSFRVGNGTQEELTRSWRDTAAWLRDKAAWCDQMAAELVAEDGA